MAYQMENPRLGVGAVILNDKHEILLVLRNRAPEKDTWSIPGGKIELYETLEEGVVREIREEVNLVVEVKELLCLAQTIQPENAEHWVSAIYVVVIKGGELRNMEEDGAIGAVQWFPLDRLPENLACFTLPAIEKLVSRK